MKKELNKLRYDGAEINLILFALSDIIATSSQNSDAFGGTDSSDDSWTKPN